jgi:predicted nucleic acid-binding protein
VIIRILRGYADTADALRRLERSGVPTYVTAVAWAEVHAGLRRGEEPAALAFLRARGEVVLDARTGRVAGDYLARYRRSHSVELADALVAAAATTSGLHLWSLNRKHYPMADLRLYAPA